MPATHNNCLTISSQPADALLIDGRHFAALLGISAASFNRRKAARQLPQPIVLSRGCHRWLLAEVRAWIEAKCPPIREWETRRNASKDRR